MPLSLSLSPSLWRTQQDGLARLCTVKYEHPQQANLQNLCMHLTNYSLNKTSGTFQQTDAPNTGSKRTYKSIKTVSVATRTRDNLWRFHFARASESPLREVVLFCGESFWSRITLRGLKDCGATETVNTLRFHFCFLLEQSCTHASSLSRWEALCLTHQSQ